METVSEHKTDHRRGWLLFVAIVASIGFLFSRVHAVKETQFQRAPLVVADPSKLDFGERWEGEKFTWIVPIKNTTDEAIEVEKFSTSCGCVVVEAPALKIDPHEVREIKVAISATIDKPLNDDFIQTKFELAANDRNGRQLSPSIWLTGRVRRLAQLEPSSIQFEGKLLCGEQTGTRKIKIAPNSRVVAISVVAGFELQTAIEKIDAGYELVVSGRPKRIGKWEPTLQLIAIDAAGQRVGKIVVPISGIVQGPVVVEPSDHYFGIVRAGSTQRLTLELRSLNGKAFSVLDYRVVGMGLSATERKASARYGLEWKVSGTGEQRANVEFRVSQEGGASFAAIVQLGAFVSD